MILNVIICVVVVFSTQSLNNGNHESKFCPFCQVTIMDTGVRGTIAVGLVPQLYKLDHQPGWLPHSVAYHADDGK